MTFRDYGPQDALSEMGAKYHARALELGADAPAPETLSYGADSYQRVDIYRAAEPGSDVLIFAHGGGWTNGYKEWNAFMAAPVTAAGITFVSIGYRLAPQHVFPACLQDAEDAVALVQDRIAGFGGRADRLFLSGHSAGGHLAARLGVDLSWTQAKGVDSVGIRGVLPISGTYLFGPDSGLSMRPRFLGAEDSGNDRAASPILHVADSAPPFLLAAGEKDFPHLARQMHEMQAALTARGATAETLVLPGADHFGAHFGIAEAGSLWLHTASTWMAQQE